MKLSEILIWWAEFSNISDAGKKDHKDMARQAEQLEAKLSEYTKLADQYEEQKSELIAENEALKKENLAVYKRIDELDALRP